MTHILRLTEMVESPHLVDESDGTLVFNHIMPLLRAGQTIHLSFEGSETVTTSFLNRAVGDLYQELPAEHIERQLKFLSVESEDLRRIERVKAFANEFYKDPVGIQAARESALADF